MVIPKAHCRSLNDLGDATLAAALFQMAREVANAEHVDESGYRVVINTGRDGGRAWITCTCMCSAGGRCTGPRGNGAPYFSLRREKIWTNCPIGS